MDLLVNLLVIKFHIIIQGQVFDHLIHNWINLSLSSALQCPERTILVPRNLTYKTLCKPVHSLPSSDLFSVLHVATVTVITYRQCAFSLNSPNL